MQWHMERSLLAIPAGGESQSNVAELVIFLIILLLVATGVALISRRLRIPYITGLVLAGLAITELLPDRFRLDSSLIFNLFLPILLFEAAINTDISRLRSTIKPIALLAGPGVLLCAGITSVLLKLELSLGWVPALLIGAILSITDTALVISVFKEVSVPSRLVTLVEGESLLNDDVVLVLFSLILTAYSQPGSLSLQYVVQEFLVVIIGGVLVGLALGYLSVGLFSQTDDPLGGILLTVAIALGAFQAGEFLHVSGVVAVVVAGLILGNVGLSRITSASTQVTLFSFWEYASFGVNTFIFLLIGLEIDPIILWETLPAVLLALIAYQVGRALTVYPLLALVRFFDRPIPMRWRHVLFLGNIKGSLSTALVLSLPSTLPDRERLIAMVLGIVVVSLVGQGLSLPWFVRRLQLSYRSESYHQIEELQAQLMTAKAAQDELDSLLKSGVLPKSVYEEMRSAYQVRVASSERTLRDIYNQRPERSPFSVGDRTKLDAVRRQLLLAEKGALSEALRRRILSEEVVHERIKTLNEQLLKLEDD